MPRKPRKTASRPASRAAAERTATVAAKRPSNARNDDTPARIARALEAIAVHLSAGAPAPPGPETFANADAFVWHPNGRLTDVPRVSRVEICLL